MPWKAVSPMSEKMRFITKAQDGDESFAALCRSFGIARKTGYKWLERYREHGPKGLEEQPPVAGSNANALSEAQEDVIVALRREHPSWGPKKLRARLAELGTCEPLPATSTFGAVLKRQGLVRPRRRRPWAPRELTGLTLGTQANDVWCVDFKGDFMLGDRTRCYPLTITDFSSRYLLCCAALPSTKETLAREVFERVFGEFGLPEYIRSDNGVPFASVGLGGLSRLAVWWIKLGITPERIEPGHPEQNGQHERMHRTLKSEATRPAQQDMRSQQRAFDRFRHVYNDVRPHEGIALRTPASRYSVSSRAMPAELAPLRYPEHMQTRRVDAKGKLHFLGGSTYLGALLVGEVVGLDPVEDGKHDLYFGPALLGTVQMDAGELVFDTGRRKRRAAVML